MGYDGMEDVEVTQYEKHMSSNACISIVKKTESLSNAQRN